MAMVSDYPNNLFWQIVTTTTLSAAPHGPLNINFMITFYVNRSHVFCIRFTRGFSRYGGNFWNIWEKTLEMLSEIGYTQNCMVEYRADFSLYSMAEIVCRLSQPFCLSVLVYPYDSRYPNRKVWWLTYSPVEAIPWTYWHCLIGGYCRLIDTATIYCIL